MGEMIKYVFSPILSLKFSITHHTLILTNLVPKLKKNNDFHPITYHFDFEE